MRLLLIIALASAPACASKSPAAVDGILTELAVNQRAQAEQTLDPRDFTASAEAYERLFDANPQAAHEHRWNLADSLLRSGEYTQAALTYEQLLDTEYESAAIYMSYRCWHLVAFRVQGVRASPGELHPKMTVAERSFVDSVVRVLAHDYAGPTEPGLPHYAPSVARQRPSMLLDAAELLLSRGEDSAALGMLHQLVIEHPETAHASRAKTLLR